MPDWGSIPWAGVLVGVVASQIIGFLWYGPLFGKQWLAGMGKTPEDMQDRSGLGAAVSVGIISSVAAAVALAALLSLSSDPDMESGAMVGLLAGVVVTAYIVITMMYEQRDRTVSWIGVANQLVTSVVVGAIIGAMW